MKLIKRWKAQVKDGKLLIANLKDWTTNLFQLNGKEVEVMVRPWSNKRTLAQNRLYWLWIDLIAESLGYDDPQEVHRGFGGLFLIDRSKKIPFIKSTTKLDTLEFSEYVTKVERYANTELNIVLPRPDDLWTEYEDEIKKAGVGHIP